MTEATSIDSHDREQFLQGLLACMLWSSTNDKEGHLDDDFSIADIHPSTSASLAARCNQFIDANAADLAWATSQPGYDFAHAGHDLMLSANGHGSGYFDRDLGEVGERLQKAAQQAGPIEAYAGDDGKVHVSGLEQYRPAGSASPRPGR